MAIHRSHPLVLTGDSQGRIDQWYVLQKAATPAVQQEEIQRANDQGVELSWLCHDPELPPRILAENHPVRNMERND